MSSYANNREFNALLKNLEEPPKHVVFILATTNPENFQKQFIEMLAIEFKNGW